MAEWPSGTVTFLFTDLEGSTQRWQQYPDAMGPALARHDRLVRDAIAAHGGVVFKTVGDAVCAAFATAPSAVAAALTAQRALYSEPWGATGPLRARMALHTGQAEVQAGDYLGGPLNRVARLLAAGHGGQILVSGPTADLVQDYLPPAATLRDLGTHRLKDLLRPEHVFQLVAPDLPADYPPLATLGPALPQPDPGLLPPGVEPAPVPPPRSRPERRLLGLGVAAVLAAVVVGAVAASWVGWGDADQPGDRSVLGLESPPSGAAAAGGSATAAGPARASPPTVSPSFTAAVAAVGRRAGPTASPAATSVGGGAVADGPGQVAYRVYDGPGSGGRVYRLAARAGATPEDLSLALDALAPPAPDDWVSIAPDGRWLLLGTERFDPECLGWPCLAVVPADLSAGEVVRVGAEVVHPDFQAAIAAGGGLIVYPKGGGPHEQDLWAIRRQGQGWGAPLLLTGASPYAYHALPALDVSGARVLFECGARPYGEEGTAICEVGTEGTGFQVVLTPADAPPGQPLAGALRHPAYTPDGGSCSPPRGTAPSGAYRPARRHRTRPAQDSKTTTRRARCPMAASPRSGSVAPTAPACTS
jgi:class 3 adenylate cyclase